MVVSSIISIVIRVTSVGLLLGLNIQLARALGPQSYGVLAFTLAWVQVLALLVQFGLPTAITRSVTLSVERGETERLHSDLYSSLVLIVMIWGAIALLCFAFWAQVTDPRGGLQLAVPALLAVLILSLGPVIAGILRGLGRVVTSQLPEQIARPGLFCAALTLAVLSGQTLTPAIAMWLQVVTAGVAVLAGSALLWRSLPPWRAPASIQPFQLAQVATPFLVLALVQGLSVQASTLVLGQIASDVELAHFRVAMQVSDALNLVLLGIAIVIGPIITQHHARQDWTELQQTVVWAHRIGFLLLLFPVIVLVLWAEPILILTFGQDYAPAHPAMQVLLVGKLAYAPIGFSGLVLAMSGEPSKATYATVLSVIMSLLIILPLATIFGVSGAAIAHTIGSMLNATICIALLPGAYRRISAFSAPLRRKKR